MSINLYALNPIIKYGSPYLKGLILKDVIQAKKFISLAISEPLFGSDVRGIQTSAVKNANGDYVVNGQKKWITGGEACVGWDESPLTFFLLLGNFADFFTTAVKMNDGTISLLVIDRQLKGIFALFLFVRESITKRLTSWVNHEMKQK